MLPEIFNSPVNFVFWMGALTIAITIHEFAHALVADRLGDPTPRLMGRLTLNPLAHLDPVGTIMILLVRFGWGKPVRFDPFNLRNPRKDSAMISLAGPAANILLAVLCSLLLQVLLGSSIQSFANPVYGYPVVFLIGILEPIIILNVVLGIFNLVPIHPLDGFKIVGGLLPEHYVKQWQELESFGMIFLILMMVPLFGRMSPIDNLISPIIDTILQILIPSSRTV